MHVMQLVVASLSSLLIVEIALGALMVLQPVLVGRADPRASGCVTICILGAPSHGDNGHGPKHHKGRESVTNTNGGESVTQTAGIALPHRFSVDV